jgi:hypothetical protein
MDYKPAKVNLTQAQAKKLVNQKPVKLSAAQIGNGDVVILLHPENHAKLSKAKRAGKGSTLYLTPGEILATVESTLSGSGIFQDIWKGLKSGYKWVKSNIVDTPLYQGAIKPIVRRGVNTLAGMAKAATGNDSTGNSAIDAVVNEVGKKTGAFGMKGVKKVNYRKSELLGSSFRLN